MAHLYLKGMNEPITIDRSLAVKIKDRFTGNQRFGIPKASPNDILEVGEMVAQYGQIKFINLAGPSPEKRADNSHFLADYDRQRKAALSLSPYERAKSVGVFKMLLWAHTGLMDIPANLVSAIHEVQEKFFTENPKRVLPDPEIFKIGLRWMELEHPEWSVKQNSFHAHAVKSALRIIEKSVSSDLESAY